MADTPSRGRLAADNRKFVAGDRHGDVCAFICIAGPAPARHHTANLLRRGAERGRIAHHHRPRRPAPLAGYLFIAGHPKDYVHHPPGSSSQRGRVHHEHSPVISPANRRVTYSAYDYDWLVIARLPPQTRQRVPGLPGPGRRAPSTSTHLDGGMRPARTAQNYFGGGKGGTEHRRGCPSELPVAPWNRVRQPTGLAASWACDRVEIDSITLGVCSPSRWQPGLARIAARNIKAATFALARGG